MNLLAATGGATMTTSETVLFWIIAPIVVVCAACLIFARRAVYAAVCVVVAMVGLAFLYVAQGAPFLGIVQVVVYTGAIMMLFVFVLMLVGVDVADSFIETIRGQRVVAIIGGLGLAAVLGGAVLRATLPTAQGMPDPGAGGNSGAVAQAVFADYPFTLEVTGTLLIIAALGAVVLTHRVRLRPQRGQRELSIARFRQAATPPTPLPAPGVYAGSNAVDVPALDATGAPIEDSVPSALRARGQVRRLQLFGQADLKQLATRPDPAPPAAAQPVASSPALPPDSPSDAAFGPATKPEGGSDQ